MKKLNFDDTYYSILKGVYEKANGWGEYKDKREMINVLTEEVNELVEAMLKCNRQYNNACRKHIYELEREDLQDIKGFAMNVACECVQVLAVLEKADQLFY